MQEEHPTAVPERKAKPLRVIVLTLLVLLLLAASAGAAYWWRDKVATSIEKDQAASISNLQKDKAALQKQLAEAKTTPSPTATPACSAKAPSASVMDNIRASITSGNTAALEGYMAASVNVVYAASEAAGAKTPTQAVTAITSFIGSPVGSSWDFELSASVLSSYGKGSYAQYFPGTALVGKSADKKVISFSFDCNAKISTVFMSASENLLQ